MADLNTFRDYVICAPKLSNSNGVRVLHVLAQKLKERGCNVKLFSVPDESNKDICITNITDEMRNNSIVVYPEFIYGNPLKFRHVVRLILYYNGAASKFQNYDKSELLFTYNKKYAPQSDLLCIPGLDEDIFYNDVNVEKDCDCYFVYKGGMWKDVPEFEHLTKITRQYPKTRKELGELLRKTKTLYSFDNCSLILDEALMCGCNVKIVKENGFEDYKSDYFNDVKDFDTQLDNFIEKTQKMNNENIVKQRNLKGFYYKNKLNYYLYKIAHKVFLPINKSIAQKCWFRAETRLSMTENNKKQRLFNIYNGKKVFVTGHTGFKGSWLSLWLTLLGAEVCGYSLEPNTEPSMFKELKIGEKISKSVIGDILDSEKLEKTIQEFQPDIVFHLAAQPLVRLSYAEPVLTYKTNVIGTLNVLEAARKCKSVKAFVNITTDKCYENKEISRGYKEDEPMGGYDMYSSSKGCVEIMSASYRRSFLQNEGFRLATARAGNVIGGGDWAKDRLIPDCVRSINEDKKIEIRNPKSVRPWQHVLEPLSGYLTLGEKLLTEGNKFAQGFNFGPEMNSVVKVIDVVKKLVQIYSKGEVVLNKTDNLHEANLLMLDISKAKRILKWKPRYNADNAIFETVEWYKHFYNNDTDMYEFTLEQIKKYESKILKGC